MTEPTLRVLMLGAGTQSTVMALMADRGEFGSRPDCAIFSDTGDERAATYAVLDWLDSKLSYPIHRADAGLKLSDGMIQMLRPSGGTVIEAPPDKYAIPAFLRDRATDKKSMSKRFCTSEYKVKPGDKFQRELLGVPKGQRVPKGKIVECWWGYSFDELSRCSNPKHKWQTYRYPLIERRLKRHHVIDLWQQYKDDSAPPLARSACVYCPFQSSNEWLHLEDTEPQSLNAAIELEEAIQQQSTDVGSRWIPFLHRRCIPLKEAIAADRDARDRQGTLFADEWGDPQCGGGCGL